MMHFTLEKLFGSGQFVTEREAQGAKATESQNRGISHAVTAKLN
jgi:hypothetical protein